MRTPPTTSWVGRGRTPDARTRPEPGGRLAGHRPASRRAATILAAALAAAAVLPALAGPAFAAGSGSAWPQFGQNGAHLGTAGEDTAQPPYQRRWRFVPPGKERALSAPITDGDVAIALGPHSVFGVDLATGRQRWVIPRNGGSTLAVPAIAEVDGTPILLFTQGDRANESAMVAFSLQDPTRPSFLWQEPLDDRTATGVAVDGDTAYTADVAGEVTAVHVVNEVRHVDVDHHLLLWHVVVPGVVPTPPAAVDGRVVVVARNRQTGQTEVDAIEGPTSAGGKARVIWTKADQAASSASAPTIVGDRVIVGFGETSGAGILMALGLKDGLNVWSARFSSPFLPFTNVPVSGGFALAMGNRLGLESGVYRVNASTGARVDAWNYGQDGLWSYEFVVSGVFASPVVAGNSVVMAFDDGGMAAIDEATGVLVWKFDLGNRPVRGLAAGGGVVLATGGSRSGGMVAFEHDPNDAPLAVVSPSKPDWVRMLTNYVIAFVAIGLAATLIGMLVRSRGRARPGPVAEDAVPDDLAAEGGSA